MTLVLSHSNQTVALLYLKAFSKRLIQNLSSRPFFKPQSFGAISTSCGFSLLWQARANSNDVDVPMIRFGDQCMLKHTTMLFNICPCSWLLDLRVPKIMVVAQDANTKRTTLVGHSTGLYEQCPHEQLQYHSLQHF